MKEPKDLVFNIIYLYIILFKLVKNKNIYE
jgi:hypothetical protein